MRHGKKFNHLGRTAPHRKAMLSNMATSLIMNKRISTTVAKAKALRKYVEPILTKAKDDTTHSRRVVFSYLNDKDSVKTLFDEVVGKIAERPGGYTRILKTGNRLGDHADMCIIELVDYNELLLEDAPKKAKTRRSRRGKGGTADKVESKVTPETEEATEVGQEEVVEDEVVTVEEDVEDKKVEDSASEDPGPEADATNDVALGEPTEEAEVIQEVPSEELKADAEQATEELSTEEAEDSSQNASDEKEEDKDKDAEK